ncbi:MAG TPA: DNRLRE domain-containing protein [Candidatus Krumholzibacteria bacterium]|nr:DNRLRE domain-containing protein [Candidatus Krumholzibacteria bacterium]
MTLKYLRSASLLVLVAVLASCGGNDNPIPPGDDFPPSKVTDLAVLSAGDQSVTLQWTAPGEDFNTGTARKYDIRWSLNAIDGTNFGVATVVASPPPPSPAGTVEQFTVTGIDTTLVTHFALRAIDKAGNKAPVSNDAVWMPAVPPPMHLTKNIPPFKDNSMYSESDTLSNGSGEYLFTGQNAGNNGGPYNRRALLAFAISDSIPAGAVIDSVELTLHVSKTPSGVLRTISLHRVTADWGEGASNAGNPGGTGTGARTNDATWGYRFFPATTWTTAGGDFDAGASAQLQVGAFGFYTWKAAAMQADVQAWLDTPAANFGWIVIGDETQSRTARRFDSRENVVPANRPVLKVYYTTIP